MKFWIASLLLIIGLTDASSNSWEQAERSQSAKADEVAHTLFLPSDRSPSDNIKKGDHIDISATWQPEVLDQALRSIYILEDIEVLDVHLSSTKTPRKEEKEGTYLVLQLTKPESIVLNYFKERAKFFDVYRRKVGDKNKAGDAGPFKSEMAPEQTILDKWLGTWQTSFKQSKTELIPEEKAGTAEVMSNRIVSKHFVQENVEHSDKSKDTLLFTYDDKKKCYRRWQFSSTGKTSGSTGKWDADNKTMTWTSVGESPSTTTTTHRFVDDDNVEWDVVTKDTKGKVLFHTEGKSVRIKASK